VEPTVPPAGDEPPPGPRPEVALPESISSTWAAAPPVEDGSVDAAPTAARDATEAEAVEPTADGLPEPAPTLRLAPVSMRAVGIDARGLRLQNPDGKTGVLLWQTLAGVSVARIGDPGAGHPGDDVFLDLLMAAKATADGDVVRCIRLNGADLAIPQLQAESSAVRRFQRLVATILKTTGATAYPSREDCLGARGFPTFPDLAAYETALVACLRLAAG
jgi:hypothetical protein